MLWFGSGIAVGIWHELIKVPTPATLGWPTAAALLAVGVVLISAGCARFGPVAADAGWAEWVLGTPIDRGMLLRHTLFRAAAAAAGAGLLIGGLIADAAGLVRGTTLAVAAAEAASAAAGCALVCRWQRDPQPRRRYWPVGCSLLLATAGVLTLAEPQQVPNALLWTPAMLAGVIATGLLTLAGRSVRQIPLASLTAAGSAATTLGFAIGEQSLEGVAAVGADSHRRATGRRRAMVGTGQRALLSLEWRRLLRNRGGIVRWGIAVVVAYVVAILVHGTERGLGILAVAGLLAGVAAVSGLATTARQFGDDPYLAGSFGLAPRASSRTALLVPYLGGVLWGIVVTPAFLVTGPVVLAVLVPVDAILLVHYRVSRGPFQPTYEMSGQYSADLVRRFVRGPGPMVACCLFFGWLGQLLG